MPALATDCSVGMPLSLGESMILAIRNGILTGENCAPVLYASRKVPQQHDQASDYTRRIRKMARRAKGPASEREVGLPSRKEDCGTTRI
jgi:hypothetical protein